MLLFNSVCREQWIRAKYERKEFVHAENGRINGDSKSYITGIENIMFVTTVIPTYLNYPNKAILILSKFGDSPIIDHSKFIVTFFHKLACSNSV